jgi:hypothetical protein
MADDYRHEPPANATDSKRLTREKVGRCEPRKRGVVASEWRRGHRRHAPAAGREPGEIGSRRHEWRRASPVSDHYTAGVSWFCRRLPARAGAVQRDRDPGARRQERFLPLFETLSWDVVIVVPERSRSRARGRLVVVNSGSREAQLARPYPKRSWQAMSARGTSSPDSRRRRAAMACRRAP